MPASQHSCPAQAPPLHVSSQASERQVSPLSHALFPQWIEASGASASTPLGQVFALQLTLHETALWQTTSSLQFIVPASARQPISHVPASQTTLPELHESMPLQETLQLAPEHTTLSHV